jgi:hypothetical protein
MNQTSSNYPPASGGGLFLMPESHMYLGLEKSVSISASVSPMKSSFSRGFPVYDAEKELNISRTQVYFPVPKPNTSGLILMRIT